MEHIKNFNEFSNSCDIASSVFENELVLEPDGLTYKTYFPKENQDDYIYVRDNRKMLWNFFDDGYRYANLKEFRSCITPKSLWKNASCLKIALVNDVIVAASIYTSFQKGMKCVGITATTDTEYRNIGKIAVVHIVKEDISLVGKFYWTECSDALEHLYEKHGGIKIPNDYLDLFIKDYKSKSEDGYHFDVEVRYSDGDIEDVNKIIYGFNSQETFDTIKRQNDERIMVYINRISNPTIKESVQVKNMSKEDYYKEVIYVFYCDRVNGNKDYSAETMTILKDAVKYLKQFVNSHRNSINIDEYIDAIENGEELISTSTVMDIHNTILI